MKFSYAWLKELSGTKKSPQQLAELLTMHAFEVENVASFGKEFDDVIVAQIAKIEPHPNADRLRLASVDCGKGKSVRVVCGAPNIAVGQKVPMACVGATLPNGMTIQKTTIRGIESNGMLCAADELGVSADHDGIMILEKSAKVGTPLADYFGYNDSILDIDILPNRAHDALSHRGVARDITALEGRTFRHREEKLIQSKKQPTHLSVRIATQKCARYSGALIEGIIVVESPQWLKNRLAACGVQSINNVVDATNYVMLETGQPLHAFDRDKIISSQSSAVNGDVQIVVRQARNGEKITLLGGAASVLSEEDIVIATDQGAIALAGVMGGQSSAVSEETIAIVLESAHFDAPTIRRTRTRTGLSTDASYRFERDIDPSGTADALLRGAQLIAKIAGGTIKSVADVYPKKVQPRTITLDVSAVEKLLGIAIPVAQIKNNLTRLNFGVRSVKRSGKTIFSVTVPTFRRDVLCAEDLIEEIARVYGYARIPSCAPYEPIGGTERHEQRIFERMGKATLSGLGFSEVYTYSFYGERDAGRTYLGAIEHCTLENPMNPDQQLLRVSMIPNLLKTIAKNLRHTERVAIFEVGPVYISDGKKKLPEERQMIVGALAMKGGEKGEIFYELKGVVDALLARVGVGEWFYDGYDVSPQKTLTELWHGGRSAEIKADHTEIGIIGEINPLILTNFDIHQRVAIFEIDYAALQERADAEREYAPLRKYPTVQRDLSMRVPDGVRVDDLLQDIQSAGGPIVLDTDLFDVYDDEEGQNQSMAFRIVFGADDRTLESKEVDAVMERIIAALEKECNVSVRR